MNSELSGQNIRVFDRGDWFGSFQRIWFPNLSELFRSVFEKIYSKGNDFKVYPGISFISNMQTILNSILHTLS